MNKNNVKIYENPADNVVSDALSDFLRDSAQKMLNVFTGVGILIYLILAIQGNISS